MCGIAGIVDLRGRETQQAEPVRRMAARMRQRGPDDEGYLLVRKDGSLISLSGDDTPAPSAETEQIPGYPARHVRTAGETPSLVALGHRRLSILDLSAHGHQPLCTDDGRYWIVYNGEIYNFREIATELEASGIRLHGHCDTEVLIKAYALWREACLDRFNGDFAFAIWDNQEKYLFCARDRLGVKPFYYVLKDGRFLFASDIKTLIASGLYRPEPDMEGLYLAMAFGMAPRPRTAFKQVAALEQGHWLRLHADGRIEQQRYWSIPTGKQQPSMREGEAVELLETRLTAAVKRRLIADVPVGTFMSGGIDSTTVSAVAAGLQPGIKAFTLAYEDAAPEMDEVAQAAATARMHPMQHVVYRVSERDIMPDLNALIALFEEPHHGMGANQVISGVARANGVKVVLNGAGGDELFAGYGRYAQIPRWRKLRPLWPLVSLLAPLLGPRGLKLAAIARSSSPDRLHTALFQETTDSERQALFASAEIRGVNTPDYLHRLYARDLAFTDPLEALSYMDLMNYVGNHQLHRADQFTMLHSLEGRFPLLDHELVEAAFLIPSRFKLQGGVQKYLLRKVAARYIAPECLTMKKKGFGLPVKHWMRGALQPLVEEKLAKLRSRRFINGATVQRWFDQYQDGRRPAHHIWHLVALQTWCETFFPDAAAL